MVLKKRAARTSSVRLKDIYIYTVLFFTFYTSGFIYNFVHYNLNTFMKAAAIAVAFLGIPMLKVSGLKKMVAFILAECFFVAWALLAGGSLPVCVKMMLRFTSLVLFFILCGEDSDRILSSIQKFIIVIATVYLAAWLLFDIGPLKGLGQRLAVSIQQDDGLKRNWTYTNYFNIYYRWHDSRVIFGQIINSTNGPFSEPGMYQIWLNFALYYELFEKKANRRIVTLLAVAVLSTTSTMGILVLAVILFGYYYSRRKGSTKVLLFIPIALIMVAILQYMITDKVSQTKGAFSLNHRLTETVDLFKGFLSSPIFGHGLGSMGAINSFMLYLYDFGILAIITIIAWCRRSYRNIGNWIQWLVLLAWAVMSMFNEPVLYLNLFFLVLMCFFRRKKQIA